jgi:hypothetical protein
VDKFNLVGGAEKDCSSEVQARVKGPPLRREEQRFVVDGHAQQRAAMLTTVVAAASLSGIGFAAAPRMINKSLDIPSCLTSLVPGGCRWSPQIKANKSVGSVQEQGGITPMGSSAGR